MLLAKKHKLTLYKEVHFWTRIWSGRHDGLTAGTEACDDRNTANGEGSKIKCLYEEISNNFK